MMVQLKFQLFMDEQMGDNGGSSVVLWEQWELDYFRFPDGFWFCFYQPWRFEGLRPRWEELGYFCELDMR